jgi:hypothetical protein
MLALTLLNTACENTEQPVDYFSDVRTIIGYDSLYSDKFDPLGTIREMDIVAGTIVLLNSGNKHSFFFIDANNGRLIAKWGLEGRGPGEYLRIGPGFSISRSQLVFLDVMKKEINCLPLSNILNETKLEVMAAPYPYIADFRPQYIAPVNDIKIALGAFEKGRFGVLDAENNISNYPVEYEYLFDFPEIQGIFRGTVFQSKIKTNEKLNKFVIKTHISDIFEIYEIDDSGINRIFVSPFQHIPKIIERPRPGVTHTVDLKKSVAGLMKMAASKELVCFTYSSDSYTEAVNSGNLSKEILCFDWNGKKIKKYILPFPISNFCVDDNYIYGTANQGDNMCIYRFEMI